MTDERAENGRPLEALPGLARLAMGTWWRTTGWALGTSLRISRRLLEMALSPPLAAEEVSRAAEEVGRAAREAVDGRGRDADGREPPPRSDARASSLREEGEELLHRSRDVNYEVEAHPAYEQILEQLAPDEGRILRLLLLNGPQPAVDVRTGGPLGMIKSRLVAPGLSMIGARAGCRYVDRVPAYLNNLFRLGMIWFSRETLPDPLRYQVLEAQPDVLGAIHSVSQTKVVRRSIHLTPFGEDFCRVCLAPEAAPLSTALPHHSPPPEDATGPQPPAAD